jgi:hypothetical protein
MVDDEVERPQEPGPAVKGDEQRREPEPQEQQSQIDLGISPHLLSLGIVIVAAPVRKVRSL